MGLRLDQINVNRLKVNGCLTLEKSFYYPHIILVLMNVTTLGRVYEYDKRAE